MIVEEAVRIGSHMELQVEAAFSRGSQGGTEKAVRDEQLATLRLLLSHSGRSWAEWEEVIARLLKQESSPESDLRLRQQMIAAFAPFFEPLAPGASAFDAPER